jgi:hypothetical protein
VANAQAQSPRYEPCAKALKKHALLRVSFYIGDPKGDAQLAPDNTNEGNAPVLHYMFDPADAGEPGAPASPGIFQVCEYAGTTDKAVTRIPDSIRACDVRLAGKGQKAHAVSVSCR